MDLSDGTENACCARGRRRGTGRTDGRREREGERRSSGKGKESERTAAGRGKLAPSRLANIFFFSLSPSPRFHEGWRFFSPFFLFLFSFFPGLPRFPFFFYIHFVFRFFRYFFVAVEFCSLNDVCITIKLDGMVHRVAWFWSKRASFFLSLSISWNLANKYSNFDRSCPDIRKGEGREKEKRCNTFQ